MPKYRALRKTWLSHENRVVNEGDVFETTFPKIKRADGTEVEMRLGSNLELVEEEVEAKSARGGRKAAEDSLV